MQIQKFSWIIRRAGLYNAGRVHGFGHCFGYQPEREGFQ
jgi:hypothetical protein